MNIGAPRAHGRVRGDSVLSQGIRAVKMVVIWGMLVLTACASPREDVTGRYEGRGVRGEESVRVVMTLAADGSGTWVVGTEEATFSWKIQDDRLQVYTRHGGVVEGQLIDGVVRLDLPGWGRLELRR